MARRRNLMMRRDANKPELIDSVRGRTTVVKQSGRQMSRIRYQFILGTKTSVYVSVNMSLDQSFSTERAYQNKPMSIYISFYLLIDFILFIKVAFHA